jgi:2',3'-cyclic-nucleotide 2'-phosphodiesterase (5'-nucleotidase family)
MRILHTNDLHGTLNDAKLERLAQLRSSANFYFDTGDAVKSGNVGIPINEDPVWKMLASLDCTAGVPGNREFHISDAGFRAKIAGCRHPLLAANLRYKDGRGGRMQDFFPNSFALSAANPLASAICFGDVAVFGVMVPMVTEKMSARHLSAFINDQPLKAAKDVVTKLRDSANTIICLSHIGLSKDVELAGTVEGIDLILGGHSHDIVDPPARIGNTWIAQAGSHGRYAGVYEFESGKLKAVYEPLP